MGIYWVYPYDLFSVSFHFACILHLIVFRCSLVCFPSPQQPTKVSGIDTKTGKSNHMVFLLFFDLPFTNQANVGQYLPVPWILWECVGCQWVEQFFLVLLPEVLGYLDQNLTSVIVNRPSNNLQMLGKFPTKKAGTMVRYGEICFLT